MLSKILIANRGEIACRIIKTCKRLGIETVCVYSDADADALHVLKADQAHHIGGAPAAQSYLCQDRIIAAAKRSGAPAIHPGFGFLSENAEFARRCEQEGIVFIGPPASAIEVMGSKSLSKRIMEEAKVPLIPGYHGKNQSDKTLIAAAEMIGFPLLIKASAGGGGKGMRLVEGKHAFEQMLDAARREAMGAFGNDIVILEKYLPHSRHIEVQIFGDAKGNLIHLFERDCSLQRRYQKVLEETPAPGVSGSFRRTMGEAAVKAAKAVDYVNAGTVEFIVDADRLNEPDSFYFMEMNTRLQVEHPVTEMVTGQDLVEWQIRVAGGEALPLTQDEVRLTGHAVEVRLYAENPEKSFLPATGAIWHLTFPAEDRHIRVDGGVRQGDLVSMHYDPMLAKLIAWSSTRSGALRRLKAALRETQVAGISTNKAFLAELVTHPELEKGAPHTRFVDQHLADLLPEPGPVPPLILSIVTLAVLLEKKKQAVETAGRSEDPYSPWAISDGWRLNDAYDKALTFIDEDNAFYRINAVFDGQGYRLHLPDGQIVQAGGSFEAGGRLSANLDGIMMTATVVRRGLEYIIINDKYTKRVFMQDSLAVASKDTEGEGLLKAPMHGRIVLVNVGVGEKVEDGQALMVIEAMKMEHTIIAPCCGVVADIMFNTGDQVEEGAELIELKYES
ncbi:MAG: ATP-grasp domain-containing protein [Desulfatitalea sp.]|nr:ATP-grasp domain-containing protein [Desulfatitalea sp.]